MKLDFDVKRGFGILRVSEKITLQDLDILRAGIARMAKDNQAKEPLVLDLTASFPELAVKPKLRDLQLLAISLQQDLFIVCEDQEIGQFKRLQEATQLLISGASLAGLREGILTGVLRDLKFRAQDLLKTADALKDKHVIQGRLPDENRHLSELLSAMEKRAWALVDELGDNRPEPRDERIGALEREYVSFLADEKMAISEYLK